MKNYEIVKALVKGAYTEAANLLKDAALGGDSEALYCLGICYARGIGVKQDIGEAFKCYRNAAAKGCRAAQTAYEEFDRQIRLADDSAIIDGTDLAYRVSGLSRSALIDDSAAFFHQGGVKSREKESDTEPVYKYKKYDYAEPPVDLLKTYPYEYTDIKDLEEVANRLVEVFGRLFKVQVNVLGIIPGPTYTRFEIEVPTGFQLKSLEARIADLEYELAVVQHIRIEAPILGKRAVAVEIPNVKRGIVGLRDIVASGEWADTKMEIPLPIGKSVSGEIVLCDLKRVPHILIAGQTGSGKSELLKSFIVGLMYKLSPEDLRFILIDPKRVEFVQYQHMPHLLFDKILSEQDETLNALKWACREMENRYALMQKLSCSNIDSYNAHDDVKNEQYPKMPRIVIMIDELADLMMSPLKDEIEEKIKTISAKARAAGIHLLIATQRPSRDVITGTVKANLASRIAFKVSSSIDSRIVLDTSGAESLMGFGDMLFYPVDYSLPKRVQSAYLSDVELAAVVEYVKSNYECDYNEYAEKFVTKNDASEACAEPELTLETALSGDELFKSVLEYAVESGSVSVSGIQRKFEIGYARAARIVDALDSLGYIAPPTFTGKAREVLITPEKLAELLGGEDAEESPAPQTEEAYVPQPAVDFVPPAVDLTSPDEEDSLVPSVLEKVIKTGKVTVAFVQRAFAIGYGRASRIIETLEKRGFIGPLEKDKPRAVYITREQYKEIYGKDIIG
ncbi:MAG: hypothetical protein J1F39_05610 [Clostridiales bacterium]|nr:hypothetical protein [Clostridiales bacterium]